MPPGKSTSNILILLFMVSLLPGSLYLLRESEKIILSPCSYKMFTSVPEETHPTSLVTTHLVECDSYWKIEQEPARSQGVRTVLHFPAETSSKKLIFFFFFLFSVSLCLLSLPLLTPTYLLLTYSMEQSPSREAKTS
jgi:hypothetical protein